MLKNSKKGENETVETRVERSKKDDPSKTKNCPGKSSSFVLARLSSPSKDQSEIERRTREREREERKRADDLKWLPIIRRVTILAIKNIKKTKEKKR